MITFEDLIKAADFDLTISHLAEEFLNLYQLPSIDQLAFCVDSVEDASSVLEIENHTAPFLISESALPNWTERGVTKPFLGKLAIGYYEKVQIEFLEAGVGSDFYSQLISSQGKTRLHHLGFYVKQLDTYTEKLIKGGFPLYVKGKSNVGAMEINFHYLDTFKQLGFFVEFICCSIDGKSFIPEVDLFKEMARRNRMKH